MRHADCAFGLVDVLTTGTLGAHGFNHEILVIDGQIQRLGNGQNGNSRRRRMDTALRFRIGHALDAMHAAFKLQFSENANAADLRNDFLIATHRAF